MVTLAEFVRLQEQRDAQICGARHPVDKMLRCTRARNHDGASHWWIGRRGPHTRVVEWPQVEPANEEESPPARGQTTDKK